MFEILGILLVLSLPVFYLWGMVSFFRTVFGGGGRNRQADAERAAENEDLMHELRRRAINEPDLGIRTFLRQYLGYEEMPAEDEMASVSEAEVDTASAVLDEPIPAAERPAKRKVDDVPAAPAPAPQPGFDLGRWYQENTVNLLLYLGAFLIVAAAALFVGFQWQNLGGTFRFALVVMFTVGWYAGGLAIQQTLRLENVAVGFITIGALLTPFCGVAWQQFVVGSADAIGVTWLLTGILTTVIYLALSFMLRRRFFTYFASLSTLAMVTALVEITDAPSDYFVLTAVATALLLLVVRVALAYAPEEYSSFYAQDVEYSSLGTLAVSIVFGLLVATERGIPFHSVQIFAVLLLTTVYAWIYVSVRRNGVTLVAAQVVTLLLVDHGLVTFVDASGAARTLLAAGIHGGLLVGINWWVGRDDEDSVSLNKAYNVS
ncbi:MAG: DUF2157 domain-containing protein, partial [Chloroflexota bacterium]